jgi:membrane protein
VSGTQDPLEATNPEGHTLPDPHPADTDGTDGAHRVEGLRRRTGQLKERYSDSPGARVWKRLNEIDFINTGMIFAAVLLICLFPFLIVVNALAGRSEITGLSRQLGLTHEAAHDVSRLFASSSSTSNAVTGAGYVLFVLGGIAAATAVQDLYEKAFGLHSRGMKDIPRRLAWLGITMGCSLLADLAGRALQGDGGPALRYGVGFFGFTAYWWFTMWFLIGGRIKWSKLFPAALATAAFWVGMDVVFSFVFSTMVVSNENKYGPIGVVFALMSYLIAVGVVIILGAVVGMVWNERRSRPIDRTAPSDAPLDAS